MIQKLDHQDPNQAKEVWHIFQQSYRVEADLIGVKDFPPLKRTIEDIRSASTNFYGLHKEGLLAGIVEINAMDHKLEICSLVVNPTHFRQGVAGDLINHVLAIFKPSLCEVETATANAPAIALYKRNGFQEVQVWMTSFGIEKIKLIRY